jgi:AMP phosphorylase
MLLKARILGIDSGGKPAIFLNKLDADELGVTASGRVRVSTQASSASAIVHISTLTIQKGFAGINEEVRKILSLKEGKDVEVHIAEFPKSLQFIRQKLSGRRLLYNEVREIVRDIVDGNLNEGEIAALVTALHIEGVDLDEATSLASSMIETGRRLELAAKTIVDKHSIGGSPGDKATLLIVPIVAAAKLTIPKTSSRAITSAAGTADRAEVLMPVDLDTKEMRNVVQKAYGCMAWGGALDLAPADDIFVRTEYPLSIDPLLLPSIMSKKKAVGTTHLVIDIPTGRGAKIKTLGEADLLARDIIELGKRLGMKSNCVVTYGEQPVGFGIGPLLEAREALGVLMNKMVVPDLVDKACHLAGTLFEMVGKSRDGYSLALDILKTGKAEKKLREIISLQGGNSDVKPDDLVPGHCQLHVRAKTSGRVLWIDNSILVEIARAAGAPKDKGSGILLKKKQGDFVKERDILFTIFAEKSQKLSRAEQVLTAQNPVGIGERMEMYIRRITEAPVAKRAFVLER